RAALPHVRPVVGAILGLMMLTGMRPGEACRVRPCDIDTTGAVWVYRPPQHKTKYRGKARAVPIGERAKAILRRFTPADPTDFYFSPARTAAEQLAERTAKRRTPLYPSHARHNAKRRKQTPKRRPGRAYTTHGLAVAVTRACAKVAVPPWHPNQIRHTHATEVRRRFGLEAAQVVPGHERADVTQVYAEKNLALAAKVAAEIE
ncbi:MAG: site-specific integrase, partial [Variovorax sp.]|nr:site-specific integrase [Variovorax sp.]